MIRKLKIKFICLAMSALVLMLTVVIVGMNVISYNSVINEADMILSVLSQNKGGFPDMEGSVGKFPSHMSPEVPYESRYFSVLMDANGAVIRTETSRIVSVDSETAKMYADEALSSGREFGFADAFRYLKSYENDSIRIVFLDCGRKLDAFYDFLWASVSMSIVGLLIIFIVIVFLAGKITQPAAESYEKQRRFITDAGHEIKTPLTIINANVDLLEADPEDTECLNDIRVQADRLTTLTNDLVFLAQMEESDNKPEMVDFPISDVVQEAVASFHALAITQDKEFICQIQPMLSMKGNQKTIQQLVNLLMDNALKYSPAGGTVAVSFAKVNHALQLNVYNTTDNPVESKNLNQVFERFYRTDCSRNSETGGHGIGLSVAKAIVDIHEGKIQAWTQDGYSFNVTCSFPC